MIRYALKKDDYYILSDTEGFIIKNLRNFQIDQRAIINEYYDTNSKYIFPRMDVQNIQTDTHPTQPYIKILFTKGIYIYIYIYIYIGEHQRKFFELKTEDGSFLLGRGELCNIKFKNKEISTYHIKIEFDKKLNLWIIYQPQGKSINGT